VAALTVKVDDPHRSPADATIWAVPAFCTVIIVPPVEGSGEKSTIEGSEVPHLTTEAATPLTTAGTWYVWVGS
jgi:hypothetical protein